MYGNDPQEMFSICKSIVYILITAQKLEQYIFFKTDYCAFRTREKHHYKIILESLTTEVPKDSVFFIVIFIFLKNRFVFSLRF